MIRPFCHPHLITTSTLLSLILLLLFGFGFGFGVDSTQPTMKVHPVAIKRNITTREDTIGALTLMEGSAPKKLRRLPHIFSKVLQLPLRSDADVTVEESSDCFRFIAETEGPIVAGDVRALAVEIHPGVTKIVVRSGGGGGGEVELLLDELEIDAWRFRLPSSTRPELATAVFVDGELVVTVPKGGGIEDGGDVWGGVGRLILVQ